MQRITLLCVGQIKSSWCSGGCTEYLERLHRLCQWEIVEIPASKERDPDRQRDDESLRLLEAITKRDGAVWVLDERGKGMASPAFASTLGQANDAGTPILFVLGGAYGLNDAVRGKADRMLSLSPMTFPHELCRLVFLEQLYRAMQIARGTGYHH